MKSKFQKRKDREKEVRKKVLRRRSAIQAEHKQEKLDWKIHKAEEKMFHPKRPINKWLEENTEKRDASIKKKLEHNMKILEQLEAEHEAEQKKREQINADLEAKGCKTPEEKIRALAEQHKEEAMQREDNTEN